MERVKTEIIIRANIDDVWDILLMSEKLIHQLFPDQTKFEKISENDNVPYLKFLVEEKNHNKIINHIIDVLNIIDTKKQKVLELDIKSSNNVNRQIIFELNKINEDLTKFTYLNVYKALNFLRKLDFIITSKEKLIQKQQKEATSIKTLVESA